MPGEGTDPYPHPSFVQLRNLRAARRRNCRTLFRVGLSACEWGEKLIRPLNASLFTQRPLADTRGRRFNALGSGPALRESRGSRPRRDAVSPGVELRSLGHAAAPPFPSRFPCGERARARARVCGGGGGVLTRHGAEGPAARPPFLLGQRRATAAAHALALVTERGFLATILVRSRSGPQLNPCPPLTAKEHVCRRCSIAND